MVNNISWWRTNFGDEAAEAASNAIKAECISMGRITEEFEEQLAQLLGVRYAVATTSGSMAILMAMIVAGIRSGDEVIMPNRSWIATAHAAYFLGAKPVFIDVLADTPIMDSSKIEENISQKTRAIVPVHMNGRSCDMAIINKLAEKYGVVVIEDAAQALCSKNEYGYLGTQSFAGCFSLSMAKLISTGQGGFVVTNDDCVYRRLRLLRTHGVESVISPIFSGFGFNFRFNDVLSSVGISQLKKCNEYISNCNSIYSAYEAGLGGLENISLIPVNMPGYELPIYVEVFCHMRKQLAQYLVEAGIETRSFYPSMNTVNYFLSTGAYPHSDSFANKGLYLPCGPGQRMDAIINTINIIQRFFRD